MSETLGGNRYIVVPYIDKVIEGLRFEYSVDARKGPWGDFEQKYPEFECEAGFWAVQATVLGETEVGYKTDFRVFDPTPELCDVTLTEVSGIILPRPAGARYLVNHYGTHPVQEAFATRVRPVTIDGKPVKLNRWGEPVEGILIPGRCSEPADGREKLIPARRVRTGSLKYLYPSIVG